jgi:hypothetical protein
MKTTKMYHENVWRMVEGGWREIPEENNLILFQKRILVASFEAVTALIFQDEVFWVETP